VQTQSRRRGVVDNHRGSGHSPGPDFPLTQEMITDIKDWLKIVEREISRSTAPAELNQE
jgi:hypothetical protein